MPGFFMSFQLSQQRKKQRVVWNGKPILCKDRKYLEQTSDSLSHFRQCMSIHRTNFSRRNFEPWNFRLEPTCFGLPELHSYVLLRTLAQPSMNRLQMFCFVLLVDFYAICAFSAFLMNSKNYTFPFLMVSNLSDFVFFQIQKSPESNPG